MWCYALALIKKVNKLIYTLLLKDLKERNKINLVHKSTISKILIYPFWYILQVICALLDCFFIGEILSFFSKQSVKNKRLLSQKEITYIAENVSFFIPLNKVVIAEKSWLAKFGAKYVKAQQMGVCVGTTIHFSRKLNNSKEDNIWLLHECIHVLQFKQRGVIYIVESLIAQRFSGYSYDLNSFKHYGIKGYNTEQQAEILSKENLKFKDIKV